jgi:hypothetical protein
MIDEKRARSNKHRDFFRRDIERSALRNNRQRVVENEYKINQSVFYSYPRLHATMRLVVIDETVGRGVMRRDGCRIRGRQLGQNRLMMRFR